MTEEEKKLFRLYGKLPTHKNVLTKMQKVRVAAACADVTRVLTASGAQDRKYFDSGDYALSKAGVETQAGVGTAIPSPEKSVPQTSSAPSLILTCLLQHSARELAALQPLASLDSGRHGPHRPVRQGEHPARRGV